MIFGDIEGVEGRRQSVPQRQNGAKDLGDARDGVVHEESSRYLFPRVLWIKQVSLLGLENGEKMGPTTVNRECQAPF